MGKLMQVSYQNLKNHKLLLNINNLTKIYPISYSLYIVQIRDFFTFLSNSDICVSQLCQFESSCNNYFLVDPEWCSKVGQVSPADFGNWRVKSGLKPGEF